MLGRGGDGASEQIVDDQLAVVHFVTGPVEPVARGGMVGGLGRLVIADAALQRLVHAMLGPGLGQRLQLDVGGVAPRLTVVVLNRLHLCQRQE